MNVISTEESLRLSAVAHFSRPNHEHAPELVAINRGIVALAKDAGMDKAGITSSSSPATPWVSRPSFHPPRTHTPRQAQVPKSPTGPKGLTGRRPGLWICGHLRRDDPGGSARFQPGPSMIRQQQRHRVAQIKGGARKFQRSTRIGGDP